MPVISPPFIVRNAFYFFNYLHVASFINSVDFTFQYLVSVRNCRAPGQYSVHYVRTVALLVSMEPFYYCFKLCNPPRGRAVIQPDILEIHNFVQNIYQYDTTEKNANNLK